MTDVSGDSLIQGLNESGYNFKSDILVVTMDDNLKHPYFTNIEVNRDNVTPAGSCILTAPKEKELAQYWVNYFGTVIVSFKMQNIDQTNTNTEDYFNNVLVPAYTKYQDKIEKKAREEALKAGKKYKEKERKQLKQRLINNYYNFSFIGKISRIKEQGKNFIIYLNDIGWKFMQKVPKEFRNTYVAGQALDDAFQAMCEFMGVEFAYSIEDLNEYNFSADGYSIEKDGEVIEDVPQILKEWSITAQEEEQEAKKKNNLNLLEDKPGLAEYNKNNSNTQSINVGSSDTKISDTNSPIYKTSNQQDPTKKDSPSKEESEKKDKEKSLKDKINEYQEEFDEKIQTLFIGNGYYPSELCTPILNYDSITIEPKAAQSNNNMNTTNNNQNQQNNQQNNNNQNSSGSNSSNNSSSGGN